MTKHFQIANVRGREQYDKNNSKNLSGYFVYFYLRK